MIHFRLDLMGNKTCPAKPLLCRNSENGMSEIVSGPLGRLKTHKVSGQNSRLNDMSTFTRSTHNRGPYTVLGV